MNGWQLHCARDERRDRVRAMEGTGPNGIDWIEVLPSKRALLVHCLADLDPLDTENVRILGGVRTPVAVVDADRADLLAAGELAPDDNDVVVALTAAGRQRALVVRTDSSGDFSRYTLRLVAAASETQPPADFDPLLAELTFSFKVDCPSDFDCRHETPCPPEQWPSPRIDYLAKDFASFRRLMLDRLAETMPAWRERSPADLGMTLVELIAHAADELSYHQDAVGTEAYLGTARRRPSVRRHARLVDYRMHDGCNARAWVALSADDVPVTLPTRTRIASRAPDPSDTAPGRLERAAAAGAVIFETRHPVVAAKQRNVVDVHTWGDAHCCLPRGATRATLVETTPKLGLAAGDVLVFEEVRGPDGEPTSANPAHRHAVRLTGVQAGRDDLMAVDVLEVAWHEADALPFALPVHLHGPGQPAVVVHGNVVLADHGLSVEDPELRATGRPRWRPTLLRTGLTHAMPYDHAAAVARPAAEATRAAPQDALPQLTLGGEGETWTAVADLLGSDAFAPELVVEMEEDGSARLRFGDDRLGRRPGDGERLLPAYRIHGGPAGNVGAGALNVVIDGPGAVRATNPIPASGGAAPEPLEDVRQYAPQAFRVQRRAVTEDDYARMAERHPRVQRAAARRRWTGSWHTMVVTADRRGGDPVDRAFARTLRGHLDTFRLAGHDLAVNGPALVALDLKLWVCCEPDAVRGAVHRVLRDRLREHFHPDRLTFGQPVYLAPVVAIAMGVPGVRRAEPRRFQRWRADAAGELAEGMLPIGPLEVARLDDDPSQPEHGRIELEVVGGL